jgi:hypothetical protein
MEPALLRQTTDPLQFRAFGPGPTRPAPDAALVRPQHADDRAEPRRISRPVRSEQRRFAPGDNSMWSLRANGSPLCRS